MKVFKKWAFILILILFMSSEALAQAVPAPTSVPVGIESIEQPEVWSFHYQATALPQYHPGFRSPYSGTNSLNGTSELKTSVTATVFLGRSLWKNGEIYFNPEMAAGEGLSLTRGVAGFPNAEIYRVDDPKPKFSLSRLYLKQIFAFGGEPEKFEAAQNQLQESVDGKRLTLVAGKFSLNDFFDSNSYSHDPRNQFFNWALMDNIAWDYAADTRGYSWGFMLEYHEPIWAVRFASVLEPIRANQLELDPNVTRAHGDNLEFEYHYKISEHPGAARFLSYWNHAHMGNYRNTIQNPAFGLDVTQSRTYSSKYGFGLNFEQELNPDLGSFLRLGWNDGQTETWAFAEVDQTLTAGINLKGSHWGRAQDHFGFAGIVNGLSKDHRDYISSGGYGFMVGDGKLNYALEEIIDTFYSWRVYKAFTISPDYQWVNHPAYNADRGPVHIAAVRLHVEM